VYFFGFCPASTRLRRARLEAQKEFERAPRTDQPLMATSLKPNASIFDTNGLRVRLALRRSRTSWS